MTGLPLQLQPLLGAAAYPHGTADIRLVETPISWVILTGEFAYKLKRPVRLPYVDLRSAERRHQLCLEELRLNRRFAPALYLDVCPIARSGDTVRVGGEGEVVEHAVRMRQFEPGQGLDELLASGLQLAPEMHRFGEQLAAIHARLPILRAADAAGSSEAGAGAMLRNLEECARVFPATLATREQLAQLRSAMEGRQLETRSLVLRRLQAGRVRECHGDLHTRNLARIGQDLVAFDCLEFEPSFRWTDLAMDTSFLFMDCVVREATAAGLAFLSGYLGQSADFDQLRLLPLFGADRALVRAKVSSLEAREARGEPERRAALAWAGRYLRFAQDQLARPRRKPRLLMMIGVSGSGKSWLAQQLAVRLPALHLRSDSLRRLVPVPHGDAYSSEATARTYGLLASGAASALAAGLDVIADATFLRREQRAEFRRLAAVEGAELAAIHCTAPEPVLRERIRRRAAEASDPSEADEAVLAWQMERAEAPGPEEGLRLIALDTAGSDAIARVIGQLARPG